MKRSTGLEVGQPNLSIDLCQGTHAATRIQQLGTLVSKQGEQAKSQSHVFEGGLAAPLDLRSRYSSGPIRQA